jgi:hypothetical protein
MDHAPPRINPAIPDSIGGLLAEEWMIDPSSTFPSFLERMMMEGARISGWQTLRTIFRVLEERLSRLTDEDRRHDSNVSYNSVEYKRRWTMTFRSWSVRIAKMFLQRVKPFGSEIRFIILYMVERSSLLYSNATISDVLYGAKRVKLGTTTLHSNSSQGEVGRKRSLLPIQKNDSIRLAFLMAFGPYLEERSESFFQYILELFSSSPRIISSERSSNGTTNRTKTNKMQIVLKTVFSLLRMTTKGTFLWYRWRYLLGRSVFFDPYSSWLNLIVRRVTMEDQEKQQNVTPAISEYIRKDSSTLRPGSIPEDLLKLIRSRGLRLTAVGVASSFVALTLIGRIRSLRQELRQERELHEIRQEQQRHQREPEHEGDHNDLSSDIFHKYSIHNKLLPPPPNPVSFSHSSSNIRKSDSTYVNLQNLAGCNPNVCPMCKQPRIHPTASTGGYVFCLKCILGSISQRPVCPVTGKRCTKSSLVRLYEPNRT